MQFECVESFGDVLQKSFGDYWLVFVSNFSLTATEFSNKDRNHGHNSECTNPETMNVVSINGFHTAVTITLQKKLT